MIPCEAKTPRIIDGSVHESVEAGLHPKLARRTIRIPFSDEGQRAPENCPDQGVGRW